MTKRTPQEAKKLLKSFGFRTARVGHTLYLYTASMAVKVQKDIKRAMERDGQSLHHSDGSKEFITFDAIYDCSKPESEAYIWDKSGDRVKHNKVRHIVTKDGTHTQEIVGTVFRNYC